MSYQPTDQIQTDPSQQPRESGKGPMVFISYRSQDPDLTLAREFHDRLVKSEFEVFMAAESLRIGDEWQMHITEALKRCDYFLLLLSSKSATSDMVTEEVRRVKRLRDERSDKRPKIMPVRVNLPFEQLLNYDIDGYLGGIQQLLWNSTADTPSIAEKILEAIGAGNFDDETEEIDEDGSEPLRAVQQMNGRPLPVAEPEWPEGKVPQDSKFYLVRPLVEKDCFKYIKRSAALIRIRAPRQMGKTSLLARILYHAGKRDFGTGQISFQLISGSTFSTLQSFLRHFCKSVGKAMRLPNKLDEFWDERNDVVDSCTTYFEEYLLQELTRPFVLGLDETDRLFQFPDIATEFFGMLRGWKDGGTNDELWGKLRIVMIHSTECYITLPVNQSPFNVGRGVRLPPFDMNQMNRLATRHGVTVDDGLHKLFELVGGHPYLVRLALYYVARGEMTLDEIMSDAHTEAGPFSDHLRRHYWNLSQHQELREGFETVLRRQASLEPVIAFKLEGMGLVTRVGNDVTISCDLYKKYFCDRFKIKL
jgi:hypothetical protein